MFNMLTAILAAAAVLPCRIFPLGARGHLLIMAFY